MLPDEKATIPTIGFLALSIDLRLGRAAGE
jgi:hypothetical protein